MSDSVSAPRNGSVRHGISLAKRAAAATSFDALYAVVGSLAKAVDGVRDEMRDNTATVDALCRQVAALLERDSSK